MAFGAERHRLRGIIGRDETILASDLLGGIKEWPRLSRPPVLVVTDTSIYVLLSGLDKGVYSIPFNELAGVGRRSGPFGGEIQLILREDNGLITTITCEFHPRDRHERTGDLITERYFGRVIKDTEQDPPEPRSANHEAIVSSRARWDTGPLLSSEQCEGMVYAKADGLYSSAISGTTATIPWNHLERFGVAEDRGLLEIRAGAPWFWYFRLEPNDVANCKEWETILTTNGVVEG
jgi:hypothetical protein